MTIVTRKGNKYILSSIFLPVRHILSERKICFPTIENFQEETSSTTHNRKAFSFLTIERIQLGIVYDFYPSITVYVYRTSLGKMRTKM